MAATFLPLMASDFSSEMQVVDKKNYLLNVAQNIDPITLFLSTTIIISLCIATSVSSSSLP